MSYRDFTIQQIQKDFQLKILHIPGLFDQMTAKPISAHLTETLRENVPLALSINTEKARSELIIAPILVELRKQFDHRISLFSGVEFNVDKDQGLNGYCDFIVSLSPEQLFLQTPILSLVEAKNENIMSGLGQCMAEMVAAKLYNEQEGHDKHHVYGVVTSGNLWKFLKLKDQVVSFDLDDYGIKEVGKIIGILSGMVEQTA